MRNLEDLSLEENMSLELMLNDIDDEEFGGLEFGGELDGGIVTVDDKGELEESLRISLLKEMIY